MADSIPDYSEFQDDEVIGPNLMARIEGLANDQLSADTRVANLEEQLGEAKAVLRRISEVALPLLLEEAGLHMSTITTPSGITVKVAEAIRGNIPKGKEEPAFKWLEDNNNGKLIKRTFAIEFGKGDE